MPAIRAALVLHLVVLVAGVAVADAAASQPITHEPTIVWYRGGFAGDARFHDVFEAIVASRIGGRGIWPPPEVAVPRWWTVLLHAPNSSIKLRLSRGLRLGLTSRTDLLPLRIHGDDQGILFTPQLGLEWVSLSSGFENERIPLTNRLHVGVGYANWWSFEGRGRTPGWTFVVGVGFLAGV